jgi:hypothetical protein
MRLEHEGSDYPGFVDNDARREYDQILLAAYGRGPIPKPFDRHHPLPTSLGGTKARGFVTITLTPSEHFRAHQLLIDFTEGEDRQKMRRALWRIATGKNGKRLSAEQYEIARQANSAALSEWQLGRTLSAEHRAHIGDANRGKKHSPEQNAAKSARQRGRKTTPEASLSLIFGNRLGAGSKQRVMNIAETIAC